MAAFKLKAAADRGRRRSGSAPVRTRAVALVRDHAGLRDVLGAVPSVHAAYRFTVKLRTHGDMLAVCIGKVIAGLREAHPEMGQTVARQCRFVGITDPEP